MIFFWGLLASTVPFKEWFFFFFFLLSVCLLFTWIYLFIWYSTRLFFAKNKCTQTPEDLKMFFWIQCLPKLVSSNPLFKNKNKKKGGRRRSQIQLSQWQFGTYRMYLKSLEWVFLFLCDATGLGMVGGNCILELQLMVKTQGTDSLNVHTV